MEPLLSIVGFLMLATGLKVNSEICEFNNLCICRRGHHEVVCRGVPFYKFPRLPVDNVYQVTIIRSGLEVIPHEAFAGSSIASLHLMQNRILLISPKAFLGLENILTTLDLSQNKLDDSCSSSFEGLDNLQWLNLKSNHLEDWNVTTWSRMGCRYTMTSLFLGSNHITYIPDGAFVMFSSLNLLDLEQNLICDVGSNSFPNSLISLSLSNNILKKVPLHAIYTLKNLRYLCMSGNLIQKLPCPFHLHTPYIEKLELSNNVLHEIRECVFNGSFRMKELHLDFNFIRLLPARVFKNTEVEKLVLANNRISKMHSDAFSGIETSLKTLDLSYNLIEELPPAVNNLKTLLYLSLKNNLLQNLSIGDLHGCINTLEVLDLSGNSFKKVPTTALNHMKNLLRLGLQDNKLRKVHQDDFRGWAQTLATLNLANNRITHIPNETFNYCIKLRELKLSFNNIIKLDLNLFLPLRKTLEVLDLSSSFSNRNFSMDYAIKAIDKLEWLQLDHNNIYYFDSMAINQETNIKHLDASNNNLLHIPCDLFLKYPYLNTINLGNNKISIVKSGTVYGIPHLTSVILYENRINEIEPYAFAHSPHLHTIVLSKNKLDDISPLSFYNLSRLTNIFLQDNLLEKFNLDVVVGHTAHLYINVSNNNISLLSANNGSLSVAVRTLDATSNNLSVISHQFISCIAECLVYLFLSKNKIMTLSLPFLPLLQVLDMSCNNIRTIHSNDLHCCTYLQILTLNHNDVSVISKSAFNVMENLRVLDLSYNLLSYLPEKLFINTKLEKINLSGNHLMYPFPDSLNYIRESLVNLDFSQNRIQNISSSVFSKLKLQALNLSSNQLALLEEDSFHNLSELLHLDLSHNNLGRTLNENTFLPLFRLRSLRIVNSSLEMIPPLNCTFLRILSLKNNFIRNISEDMLVVASLLRHLDVSNNVLQDTPIHLWSYVRHLQHLDISKNPIEVLGVNSFANLNKLQKLDISGLLLKRLDIRMLHGLRFLTTLRTDSYSSVRSFRLQDLLAYAPAIRKVSVNIEETTLSHQVQRAFGTKLRELVITGSNLRKILPDAFAGLLTHELTIRICGTLVKKFPDDLLKYLPDVRYLTLDLRHNQLDTMDPRVLAAVTKEGPDVRQTQHITGGVLLEENPWKCSCELLWLGKWLKRWLRETFHVHMLGVEASLYVNSVARKATCTLAHTNATLAIIDLGPSDVACAPSNDGTSAVGAWSEIWFWCAMFGAWMIYSVQFDVC